MLDNYNPLIIIRLLRRWCWNWQTGVVEGHVPLGREGSTPSQRTQNDAAGVIFDFNLVIIYVNAFMNQVQLLIFELYFH